MSMLEPRGRVSTQTHKSAPSMILKSIVIIIVKLVRQEKGFRRKEVKMLNIFSCSVSGDE